MEMHEALVLIDSAERAADPMSGDGPRERAKLKDQLPVMQAALDGPLHSEPEAAMRLLAASWTTWYANDAIATWQMAAREWLAATSGVSPLNGPATTRARLLVAVAEVANRLRDLDGAEQAANDAAAAGESADDPRAVAMAHTALAGVRWQRGDLVGMEAATGRAVAAGRRDEAALGHALHLHALAAKARGDASLARARFAESRDWGVRHGNRRLVATEDANLGDVEFEAGDDRTAARRYADALEGFVAIGAQEELPSLVPGIAASVGRAGREEAAARLVGAAETLGKSVLAGEVGDPADLWTDALDAAEARLGAPQWAAARSEGAAMLFEEASRYAVDVARTLMDP